MEALLIGTLGGDSQPRLPRLLAGSQGCIWIRQIITALKWIRALLARERGAITRVFHVAVLQGRGDQVSMTFDASPWGLGANMFDCAKLRLSSVTPSW